MGFEWNLRRIYDLRIYRGLLAEFSESIDELIGDSMAIDFEALMGYI